MPGTPRPPPSVSSGASRCGAWRASSTDADDRAADAALDRVDLRQRPVLVVLALDQQRRRRHAGQHVLDVPGAELGREPDVVPQPERALGVAVVARHPLAEVGGRERLARLVDARHRDVLDEHVRGEQDQPAHRVARGVDERDRAAVAVADEHRAARCRRPARSSGRTSSASSCMKRGVAVLARHVGLPVAGARVEQRAAARRRRQPPPGSRATARPSRDPRAGTRARARRPRSPRSPARRRRRSRDLRLPPDRAQPAAQPVDHAAGVLGRPQRGRPLALGQDRRLVVSRSARQRAPKPTCQRSSRSTSSVPCAQPRQPVVDAGRAAPAGPR